MAFGHARRLASYLVASWHSWRRPLLTMPAVLLGRWLAGISARDCGRLGWQKWWHRHTKGNLERRVQPSVPRAALGSATLVPPSSIGRSPLGHRPATSAEATTGPAGPRGRERPRENYITAIKTCVRDLEEAVRGNGNVRLESNPIAGHSLLLLFCRRPHHAKLPFASPRRNSVTGRSFGTACGCCVPHNARSTTRLVSDYAPAVFQAFLVFCARDA